MAAKVLVCGDFSAYPIDFQPLFDELLARVPPVYLARLESIRLIDQSPDRSDRRRVLARYFPKSRYAPPWIEVYISACFDSWGEDKPQAEFGLLYKFCFAWTLYHEIGHHHHHWFQHGVRKQQHETFAEQFAREQCIKLLTEHRELLMAEFPKFWRHSCFRWLGESIGVGRFIELLLSFGGEHAEWIKGWMMQFAPEVDAVPEGRDPEGFAYMKKHLAPVIQKVREGKL